MGWDGSSATCEPDLDERARACAAGGAAATVDLPVIDIAPLLQLDSDGGMGAGGDVPVAVARVAQQIGDACRGAGFFYIVGHGVPDALQRDLMAVSRAFFAWPQARKMALHMSHGGRAWRGYFPVGEELTSGLPDQKEGLYFGSELPDSHPRVVAGTPLHGRNLFPDALPALRTTVLSYIDALTALGHRLMAALSLSLGLPARYFWDRYTHDPLTLFRIFHYPTSSTPPGEVDSWGVGEHTDYGVLTLLLQDDVGGLSVKTGGRYVAAPPIPGSLVCNIGDMLERMTGGLYKSTPHRVRNTSGRDRLSFPFFFDPGWDSAVQPIDCPATRAVTVVDDSSARWDGASVHAFAGTYGDYLQAKVGKVFPALRERI